MKESMRIGATKIATIPGVSATRKMKEMTESLHIYIQKQSFNMLPLISILSSTSALSCPSNSFTISLMSVSSKGISI
jgi:hypothetical protein